MGICVTLFLTGGKHWASNRATTGTASHYSPSSADVEMTSYVLMTYMVLYSTSEVVVQGLPVSRWLVQRRNSRGGFGSTQVLNIHFLTDVSIRCWY